MADWVRTTVREQRLPPLAAGRSPASVAPSRSGPATLLIYLFATTTLVQAYVVPSGSMEGNLLVGDHILVDRVASPIRGRSAATSCRIARWSAAISWRSCTPKTFARRT